jgi:hypothetical protein
MSDEVFHLPKKERRTKMKQWKRFILIMVVTILTSLCYNAEAMATDVLAGVDLWVTTAAGNVTYVDCSLNPLPPDFFGPGSDPFDGIIYFKGVPLSAELGLTDTVVERLDDAILPTCPSSDTVDIEIIALDLVSTEPITVTYNGGQNPESWDVQMCLSDVASPQTGSMTINQNCAAGGTFSAALPVKPKLTFVSVGPALERDYYPGTITYTTNGHWLYDDNGFNVITSPGTVSVDHDCNNSTLEVTVGSSSNFYPGLKATPCSSCPGPVPSYSMVITLWQSSWPAAHGVYPPQSETPIPTLTEWGIIILMTVILVIGVVMLRKRRLA